MSDRPSKKQKELLGYIEEFIKINGYGPSYREIMRALDYKSVSTVAVHINNLISKGRLVKRGRSARSLEVVASNQLHAKAEASVEPAQHKWLVDEVMRHFDEFEKAPDPSKHDRLCILTGALVVLGLDDAARAARARLS